VLLDRHDNEKNKPNIVMLLETQNNDLMGDEVLIGATYMIRNFVPVMKNSTRKTAELVNSLLTK
jgi:hypothetical protein